MKELNVKTSKPYSIVIERGALHSLGTRCAALFPRRGKVLLVGDSNVLPLYGAQARQALSEAGFTVFEHSFPAGEESKRLAAIEEIYASLAENRFTRTDFLVALGGGVTGDMAGFAAATYLRGMPFVQVPTSLLAQVDSSVGGKTGVDLPQGKNLVGAFWQPRLVVIDPNTLSTLPPRFFADGMGEVIKYGCIKSRPLFDLLQETEDLSSCLEDVIYQCVDCKRRVVEQDEFDTGERMLLNFGHTFGHALERLYDYGKLTHGAAVGVGMVLMARLGEAAGLTKPGTAQSIANTLRKYGLPVSDPAPLSRLAEITQVDKKNLDGKLNLVLLHEIGSGFVHHVTHEELCALTAPLQDEGRVPV